jgi:L-threonylcarbamoyladenylate synthase
MSTDYSDLDNKSLIDILLAGGLAIIPTDTQYGLVACASNQVAVVKLYKVKQRDKKPGTLIAASVGQLVELGLKARYLKAVESYWPGPISIVIPVGFDLPYLHLGKMTLAVRIPNDKNLTDFLQKSGPLLTTSANNPGDQPAGSIVEAKKIFRDKIDAYVDGGDLSGRKPSTVIRVVDDAVEVLREGASTIDPSGKIMR